ncbi:hypothetical protein Zmor_023838 [Zophobas morio]|uniref:Sulfotransferase n=1 Tax=Zophobas morio TaxID=2755281 RepID=A0AA38HXM4_9CUCU|nr:hypothetical protein Zmor_023838 [Zophobas morio]
MNSSTKLLVVLRDPVKRPISEFSQAIAKKPKMKTFEQLFFLNTSISSIMTCPRGRQTRDLLALPHSALEKLKLNYFIQYDHYSLIL